MSTVINNFHQSCEFVTVLASLVGPGLFLIISCKPCFYCTFGLLLVQVISFSQKFEIKVCSPDRGEGL